MTPETLPDRVTFLQAPLAVVASVAPPAVFYSVGGTRRHAVFSGLPAQGDAYARWTRDQMLAAEELLFRHGVRHLFMMMGPPAQFKEVTEDYREHLWRWIDWGLAGAEAMQRYQQMGWRVHLLYREYIPELRSMGERLEAANPPESDHNLWYIIVPGYELPWRAMGDVILQVNPQTPAQAVQAFYGEPVPPISLYLGSGKPVFSSAWLPPFLTGSEKIQCYWLQKPGYSLDESQLRVIFYDYAYLRQTWQADKGGRAEQALVYRHAWESAPVLGLGRRLGAYWYPSPFPPVQPEE